MAGLINFFDTQATNDGRTWYWVRRWNKNEVAGVKYVPLAEVPSVANVEWNAIPSGQWATHNEWRLLIAEHVASEPSPESLQQLETVLSAHRGKPPRPLSSQLTKRLNDQLTALADFVAACAKQRRAVGFFSPDSVFYLGTKLLLPDFGFLWDSQVSPVYPPWLRAETGNACDFWDLSPDEINRSLIDSLKDPSQIVRIQAHDVRVTARIIAAVLVGRENLELAESGRGFRIPDGDRLPQTRNSRLFGRLAAIVNADRPEESSGHFSAAALAALLRDHPPSGFFAPPPPPPPFPWKRVTGTLTLGAVLIAGPFLAWRERERFFPPPPPPPRLCPECPGTSLLRQPADELESRWTKSPEPTVELLESEFAILKDAAQRDRSLDYPDAEKLCLKILASRFDQRLGSLVQATLEEFREHPPTSDQACGRLEKFRKVANELEVLVNDNDLELYNPETGNEASSVAPWRAVLQRLDKLYQCQ